MATIRERGDLFYVQWYDAITKKVTCKSTGLQVNEANRKLVKKYAKELQQELTKRSEDLKQIGGKGITIRSAFDHFLKNNQQKHPKTIIDYWRFYKKFTEHFDENQPCTNITKVAVEDWLNMIKLVPQQKNSIHGYGKQCYHFLNFLFEYSYTPMFKINRDVRTRPEVKEKIIFTDEDITKIFNGLKSKNKNFTVAIYMLFYTGLRSSDILSIQREKIDLLNSTIHYYSPKRKKFREIPFHSALTDKVSSRLAEKTTGKLIDYKIGDNLSRAVYRYFKEIGLNDKGYSARTFRKTFITLCRSRFNMDASVVRELVGHEHGNTTDRYYNQIQISTMKQELEKFKRPDM
jgi:integrase